MAAQTAARTQHATLSSTTADSVSLSKQCAHVRVTNRHASNVLYVTVNTGRTAAAALAGVTTAVADADETIAIAPGTTKVVFSAKRPTFVALSVVGNANPYDVEGFEYFAAT